MNTHPIGIFDSGVGGLTVYQALKRALPHESFLYLGDTARVPYGTKTSDTIIRYTLQAAKQLTTAGIKFLVIACNTATGPALSVLRKTYPKLPIIGVIEPGAKAALALSKTQHIGVIATPATVRAQGYEKAILKHTPQATVLTKAAPLLVSVAEEGLLTGLIPQTIAEHYLQEWLKLNDEERPDTLILGCTHFPVLSAVIHQVVGNKMQIVDSAESVAVAVKDYFEKNPELRNSEPKGNSTFWVTDGMDRFINVAHIFLDEKIEPSQVHLIDLI